MTGHRTDTAVRNARKRLVESHLDLVALQSMTLRRELHLPVDREDLEAYGYEGLVRASRRFDPRLGVPFDSYARHRVRGAILDGVAELGGLPRRLYRRHRFERAATDLVAELTEGRAGARHIREALHTAYLLASHATGDWGVSDVSAEHAAGKALASDRLVKAMATLPERDRCLLHAHYYDGVSLAEAGRRVGLTSGHATRVHRQALARLRRLMGMGKAP